MLKVSCWIAVGVNGAVWGLVGLSPFPRSTRVVQSGWSFSFRVLDNQGVTKKTASNATSFTVTGDEVHSYNGTNVHITATKS